MSRASGGLETVFKFCEFLYKASRGGIAGVGIAFVFILAIISLARLEGRIVSGKVDVTSMTEGVYVYLWVGLIIALFIGWVGVTAKWLRNRITASKTKGRQ